MSTAQYEYNLRQNADRVERELGVEFNDARVSPAFTDKKQTFSEFQDNGFLVTPNGKIVDAGWLGGAQ